MLTGKVSCLYKLFLVLIPPRANAGNWWWTCFCCQQSLRTWAEIQRYFRVRRKTLLFYQTITTKHGLTIVATVRSEAKRVLQSQSAGDNSELQYLLEYYSLVREGKANYISTTAFHDITNSHPQEPEDFFKVYAEEFRIKKLPKKRRTSGGKTWVSLLFRKQHRNKLWVLNATIYIQFNRYYEVTYWWSSSIMTYVFLNWQYLAHRASPVRLLRCQRKKLLY